jgi:nitrous oxidase accessory protein NosD
MIGRSLAVVLFLLCASLAGMSLIPSARAATLYVGGSEPGNYTTIQAAVDAASPGDIVDVYKGTYYENVVVDESISLVGEDRLNTIIDGGGLNDVVRVKADEVLIESFTIRNSGDHANDAGVFIDLYSSIRVRFNRIVDSTYGVYAFFATSPVIEYNDILRVRDEAVMDFESYGSHVRNNNVSGSDGIALTGERGQGVASGNVIIGGGIGTGGYGRTPISGTSISGNIIIGADVGIVISWGSWCSAVSNTVHSSRVGVFLETSMGTLVGSNNLMYNDHQASDWHSDGYVNFSHTWDYNYWSDYTGVDADGDGIGDTPYVIDADAEDPHPQMTPNLPPPRRPWWPRNLTAEAGSSYTRLDWREPEFDGFSSVTNYSIYRGTEPGTYALLTETGNVTSYEDFGIVAGRTYYYRVSAKNAIGEGSKSNEANATFSVKTRPPHEDVSAPWTNMSLNWTGPLPPTPGTDGSQMPPSDATEVYSTPRMLPGVEPERRSIWVR